MTNVTHFLCQAFPMERRTVLAGLGHGALLVAVNFYPLPALLEKIGPSKTVCMVCVAVLTGILLCFLLWQLLSGRFLARSWGMVGWTAVGYLVSGLILAGFLHDSVHIAGKSGLILGSGLLLLVGYTFGFLFHHLKNREP